MNSTNSPVIKDLVLIGGGHSHVAVLRMFGMKPVPGVRITLITRDVHTPYSGMLPGYIAGHYSYDEAHIDLRPLSVFAGARLFHTTAGEIDFENRLVQCSGRPPVKYDVLSINIGSQPDTGNVPGASEHTLPIKPIDQFLHGWKDIVNRVGQTGQVFRLTVVGTGAGGVEMSLATQYRLQHMLRQQHKDPELIRVRLIGAARNILPTHNDRVRRKFMRVLQQRGIELHTGSAVSRITGDTVYTGDTPHATDATLWVTHAAAQPWPGGSGLDTDERGFIRVNDCLQSTSHPDVFAVGDIAAVVNHPREKSGVFAVRQGPPLAANLRRYLCGQSLRPFRPQTNFLGLISTGNQYAVASRGEWSLEGAWLWKIKDWIDQRFMEKFSQLPEMTAAEDADYDRQLADEATVKQLSAIAMRCGGCGAKIGSTVLSRVINRLSLQNPVQRDDVIVGLNAPDDAAVLAVPDGYVMVQSVDYFRAFIDDAYTFGRIAANHALGDVFAMGAEAQSALAIATLPYGREEIVEDQLYQVMSGAISILSDSGCALVGGHSSEGTELAFGLTVNGIARADSMLRKGGMQAGQVIILTKPVGTGTLLAADMRSKAKGRWVYNAIDHMQQSNRQAALTLAGYGATACTDVTGFGLLGHLVEMTRASKVHATIKTPAVPLLAGAIECIELGIFSSLQPQNIRLRRALVDNGFNRESPVYSLLFDPQTAGGLLATVPPEKAGDCITALQQQGYSHAAIIGTIHAESHQLESITLT